MANGSTVYNGFLKGRIIATPGNDPILVPAPFAAKAKFTYKTGLTIVKTMDERGIMGTSAACPYDSECQMTIESNSLTKSFLSLASDSLLSEQTANVAQAYTVTLSTVATGKSTLTLPSTPVTATQVLVGDNEGTSYVVDDITGSVITLDDDYTGVTVTVNYYTAPVADSKMLALGNSDGYGQVTLLGVFSGCPDSLYVVMSGQIQADLSLETGKDGATAMITVEAIRDNLGNYAYLKWI